MKFEDIENLLKTQYGALQSWTTSSVPVNKDTLLTIAQEYGTALNTLCFQHKQWRDAAMSCTESGHTEPCVYRPRKAGNNDWRRCTKCDSLHPVDANTLVEELTAHVEECEKNIGEARQLTQMLVRAASGQDSLKWVDVLAREILERLKEED